MPHPYSRNSAIDWRCNWRTSSVNRPPQELYTTGAPFLFEKPAIVTVTASPDTQSDVGAGGGNPIALNFTPDNCNVPQLVTVQAVDDTVAQGARDPTIAHKVTSTV
ncbi:MAG: hypothetical protein ACM65L_19105 [Microcoleus sp.]